MTDSAEVARRLGLLARAETSDLLKLVETAGLDPESDFKSANLNGVDVRGQDLSRFDFTDASFHGALIAGARFNHTVSTLQMSEARDAPSLALGGGDVSRNRVRAVSELVAVDAWLGRNKEVPERTDLHVDVSFGIARLGGEESSPVRFRLSLRKAEIVVVVPEGEPVKVDRTSIWRGDEYLAKSEVSSTKARASGAKARVSKLTGANGLEAGLSASASSEKSSSVAVIQSEQYPKINFSSRDNGEYRWFVTGFETSNLEGRPWNSSTRALFQVIDMRTRSSFGLPPALAIEVRCLREDLVISDIRLREESLWNRVNQRRGHRNRVAAAEAYLRDLLVRSGLASGNLADEFSTVTLARMVVSEDDWPRS
jgi:uncharacterized protein YjbI with pentapeptide repeats